ncbi:hypothetical protein F5Y12DRAFT_720622 [Xylaria sp. FL1777]|nr:hypothetical protein F5Y12DRAFT_720622 [Xylaria sp. FL1777]
MLSDFYRVYVRFGKKDCVRFLAPGNGAITSDGLQLFQWIKDPVNIARLQNGLQHVYEVDQNELRHFLTLKILEDPECMEEQINNHLGRSDILATFKKKWTEFNDLRTGVDKLEAISNAKDIMVIPRASTRKRSDEPGWLYLLDLDQETLEIYEFQDYRSQRLPPFARLTIESLYQESPNKPPGYYIKLKLSDLQTMWRSEWIRLHQIHAEALDRLWRRNARVLQTIPHADSIPFAVLYGSAYNGHDGSTTNLRGPRRLTHERLTEVVANLNRRQPSSRPIIERKYIRPRGIVDDRVRRSNIRMFRLWGETVLERQQRRARRW